MKGRVPLTIIIIGSIILGLIVLIGVVVGDKAKPICEIEIQNNTTDLLIKMTKAEPNGTLTTDSVRLKHKEKIVIGHCWNCSIIDTTALDYYSIEIFHGDKSIGRFRRQEQLNYLKSKERVGCSTYQVN